ncbi:LPXTG cell wall anchor domain-containing protein [Lactiplantibacillus fabifermentans]
MNAVTSSHPNSGNHRTSATNQSLSRVLHGPFTKQAVHSKTLPQTNEVKANWLKWFGLTVLVILIGVISFARYQQSRHNNRH